MNVDINQIQNGLANYIDTNLIPKLDGLDKFIAGGLSVLYINNFKNNFNAYKDKPILQMTGAINEEGLVDIDMIYNAFYDKIPNNRMNVKIKGLDFVFTQDDITALRDCIKGA